MTTAREAPRSAGRPDPILPNAMIVARREYGERVGSRLFHLSTLLLAGLAVIVAFIPLFARAVDRQTTSEVGVAAADEQLAEQSIAILGGLLGGASEPGAPPQFAF